jgi:hypothetical protein
MSRNVGKEIGAPARGMSARDCRLSARLGRLRPRQAALMGDRLRLHRSSGLRLLVRLASLLAALFVLCTSGRAAAASGAVPMCGEHNESIAAPPIFRAYEAGSIVASPCHSEQLKAGSSSAPTPERMVVQERPERVLSFGALCLSQNVDARLPIASASHALRRPGFARLLDRPPRA